MFGRRKHYPTADPRGHVGSEAALPLADGPLAGAAQAALPRCTSRAAARRSPLDSDEGRRLMLANAAAMNYGFAFRIAVYAGLRRIAADVFGGSPGQLVVDSPHNSIYEEEVGGERGRGAPAQLVPGLPGGTDAARNHLRPDRPGGAGARAPTGPRRTCAWPADRPTRCTPRAMARAPWSPTSPAAGSPSRTRGERATLRFRYDDAAPAGVRALRRQGRERSSRRAGARRPRPAGRQDAPVRSSALRRIVTAPWTTRDSDGGCSRRRGGGRHAPAGAAGRPPYRRGTARPARRDPGRPAGSPAGRAAADPPDRRYRRDLVDRQYVALPSLRQAIVVVEDTADALRWACRSLVAPPPGVTWAHAPIDAGAHSCAAVPGRPGYSPPGGLWSGGRHDGPGLPRTGPAGSASSAARGGTCARC